MTAKPFYFITKTKETQDIDKYRMRYEGGRKGQRGGKRLMESGTKRERSREMGWVTGERRRERGKKGRQWLTN